MSQYHGDLGRELNPGQVYDGGKYGFAVVKSVYRGENGLTMASVDIVTDFAVYASVAFTRAHLRSIFEDWVTDNVAEMGGKWTHYDDLFDDRAETTFEQTGLVSLEQWLRHYAAGSPSIAAMNRPFPVAEEWREGVKAYQFTKQ